MKRNADELLSRVRRGNMLITSGGLTLAVSDSFYKNRAVRHGFSTRVGGISPAPFDSLNFSLSRDDSRENIFRNIKIFCSAFSIPQSSLVLVNHEHGANIVRVSKEDSGRGLYAEPLPFCDGMITNDPSVTLVTVHADCASVYLYDEENAAIGLAHAGWKGTFGRVAARMADRMCEEFGSRKEKLCAAVGPCICKNCFEVDEALGDDFVREFGYDGLKKAGKKGKAYVDIEAALALQLIDAGLLPENISAMGLCTLERRELFHSYRRDGKNAGAMLAFLRLEGGGY